MIGPTEVNQWAASLYGDYLRSLIDGSSLFPLRRDRLGRVSAAEDPKAFAEIVTPLWSGSKQVRGFGYTVVLAERQRRKRALQNEPVAITIESEEDYLALLEKQKEVAAFRADVTVILAAFPETAGSLRFRPTTVTENHGDWPGILEVVRYLCLHPRPGCFVRALPVGVHTKFIETHGAAIESLLMSLPDSGYDAGGATFAQRCGFLEDQSSIRGRFLCPELQKRCGFPAADVTLRVDAWATLSLPADARVVACENKTNFLALPDLPNVLALWGEGGAATGHFPRLPWLQRAGFIYWGDLDPCGLAILALLREAIPPVRSILMDSATVRQHEDKLREANAAPGTIKLDRLLAAESEAAIFLGQQLKGIEQEKLLFRECLQVLEAALL